MPRFKITDDRYGGVFHAGVNGRILDIPVGEVVEGEDSLIEHIRGLGVSVEEISKRAGSSSEEGSAEVEPALIYTDLAGHAKLADAGVAEAAAEAQEAVATEEAPAPAEAPPAKAAKKAAPKKAAAKSAKKK